MDVASVVKSWIIPSGVDPETAFKIEAKVEGFWNKKDDGKKVYVKGKTFTWVVDSDRFSLCDLNVDLLKELGWGKDQAPKFWILDKNDGREAALVSESQIPEMFKVYEKERVIVLRIVVSDSDGSSNCSTNAAYPCTPTEPIRRIEIASQSQADCTNEFFGLNEEHMYDSEGENVPTIFPGPIMTSDQTLDDSLHEEPTVDGVVQQEPIIIHDLENPKIEVGAAFPDVATFRKALRHFSILNQFEVTTIKSDKKRFIGKCKHLSCPWRIRAYLEKKKESLCGMDALFTFSYIVKKLPHEHSCPSTTMVEGKMVSKSWISNRAIDWLRKNPSEGPKAVKNKLEDEFHVKISYNKAFAGTHAAFDQIHGSWEESFQMMYNFKCELDKICPGSIVEVEDERVKGKVRFSRAFVALKPCIEGFLHGCRPYLGVDSTVLTGKWRGQLASACGIDGHNWLCPVAYGVFDLETTDNWTWFMTQLRKATGNSSGLVISSYAGKGLGLAISRVFPECEQRECMRHLMENFKKKFHGEEVANHMWAASKAYTVEACQFHLDKVKKLAPIATRYLDNNHKHIWCRSQFSELSKCDYVNNNISESFNSWIKDFKSLHVVDIFDQIRGLMMATFDKRRNVGNKLQCLILPNVMKDLNAISRNTDKVKIVRGGNDYAEVSGVDIEGRVWRNVVELDKQQCACREWQITGLPCIHAIAFICSLRGARMEDYVHEFYSSARFKVAYAEKIPALNDKLMWEKADLAFKVFPPLLKRPPGRPRKERIPECLEKNKKRHRCKKCRKLGHQQKTCKEDDPEVAAIKRRRRGAKIAIG